MKTLLKTAFLFSLLMTLLVACKKEDDTKDTGPTGPSGPTGSTGLTGPTGTTTCRITGIAYNYSGITTGTVSYTYDSQKRLIRQENNSVAGSYSVYTYGSGSVNIKSYNADTLFSEGNGLLNSAGQITEMSYDGSGLQKYTYDSDGRLIKFVNASGNGYVDSTIYELQGGNIVKNTQANTNGYKAEKTYTYYTDKPGQYTYAGSELFGGKPNTNIVKSLTSTTLAPITQAPSTINYTYEFDTDGKVTKITIVSGANTNVTNNTYTCN